MHDPRNDPNPYRNDFYPHFFMVPIEYKISVFCGCLTIFLPHWHVGHNVVEYILQ